MDYKMEVGRFPPSPEHLVREGRVDDSVLYLPSVDKAVMDKYGFCYVTNIGVGDSPDWPILFEAGDLNGDGACVVCFLSGETRWLAVTDLHNTVDRFEEDFVRLHGYSPVVSGDCASVDTNR